MAKSHAQYCGLARALDHVGDRWTLLIIRELLIGECGFRGLLQALPGAASNLLAQRLGQLEADGLVSRSDHPARSKAVRYALTPRGRALTPAIFELIRWGGNWMTSGPAEGDLVEDRWLLLALRALLDDRNVTSPVGVVRLQSDNILLDVNIGADGRTLLHGHAASKPRATIQAGFPALLALAAGHLEINSPGLHVTGNKTFAAQALAAGASSTGAPVHAALGRGTQGPTGERIPRAGDAA